VISINVLLFGDHTDLANRCLSPLLEAVSVAPHLVLDVRIGLNAVTPATQAVVNAFGNACPVVCRTYSDVDGRNVLKYPLMRKMFNDAQVIRPTLRMWFDDDSYVKSPATFLPRLREFWDMETSRGASSGSSPAVVGALYRPTYSWTLNELSRIRQQPWFNGVSCSVRPLFATGGWWTADADFLREHDYPFPAIAHNGGDVILGELCRQQSRSILIYREGVAINADAEGRESRARRRGATTLRPFEVDPDKKLHAFEVVCKTYGGAS
jgi:hypothetical protein